MAFLGPEISVALFSSISTHDLHVSSDQEGQFLLRPSRVSLPFDGGIQGIWKAVLKQAEKIRVLDGCMQTGNSTLNLGQGKGSTFRRRTLVRELILPTGIWFMRGTGIVGIVRALRRHNNNNKQANKDAQRITHLGLCMGGLDKENKVVFSGLQRRKRRRGSLTCGL